MDNPNQNPNVETYTGDVAKALEGNQDGLIKKIIKQQEEREEEKRSSSPVSKKNKFFAIGSLILLALAIIILASFVTFKKRSETVVPNPQFRPLIYTDKTEFKEIGGLSKDEIASGIFDLAQTIKVKEGGIAGVYLTENKKIIGLRTFVSLTESSLLPENLIGDGFMFGVKDKDLFMLLKARSFQDLFPPMRAWEEGMFSDLHGFFGIKLDSSTNYLLRQKFADTLVGNRNARVLYNREGSIVLMYVFADNNSVVITDSETATEEVILRLNSDQTNN